MKRLACASVPVVLCLLATLALSGCAGSMSMPDTGVVPPTTEVTIGAIKGSNFGGHAPIEGAEIFILQAGTSYAGSSTNRCDTGTVPVTCNADPAGYGAYASKTAADGSFTVNGEYTCTSGFPVYLVAVGGYQTPNQGGSGYGTGPLTITGGSSTDTFNFSNFTWDNTVTFTANNLLYPGQTVTIAGLANGTGGANWPSADGIWTITAATTTTFTITGVSTGLFAGPITGAPASGATATVDDSAATNNPAIINMAVLGTCPSGTVKNFGSGSPDAVSYVYMNEVSTAASAYALSAFGSDAFHIGFPSGDAQAQINIQNAVNNANQLYSIEGANTSGIFDGEGHIANYYTPGSYSGGIRSSTNYGIVDQVKLDTLGNILASCVDSTNTYGKGFTTGTTTSANCGALFANATSSGAYDSTDKPGVGIVPADIATAAFNIAHHPSGAEAVSGTFAGNLTVLQGTVYPFSPATSTVDDFTIGITYYAVGINSPQGIAIDSIGDAFITNYFQDGNAATGHFLVGLNPLGVPLTNSPFDVPGARTAAFDASGNVWATGQAATFYELPIGASAGTYGSTVTSFPFTKGTESTFGIAVDSSGNLDITSYGSAGVFKYNTLGVYQAAYNGCAANAVYVALAEGTAGDIWTDSDVTSGYICNQSSAGVKQHQSANYTTSSGTTDGPNPFAIDGAGTAWVPAYETAGGADPSGTTYGGALIEVTSTGTTSTITSGGIDGPASTAVDGSGNIWVANQNNQTVSEFTGAGVAITGSNAYRILDSVPGSNFDQANVAIDGSGDVWLAFNGSNSGNSTTAIELIGAASPVVTPLATAVKNSKLGTTP